MVATALLASAGACSDSGSGGDGKVKVVAAFFPMAELARAVGGNHVAVTTLTPPGVEPHDLELNTRQVDQAHAAAVIVYLGHGFQPGVQDLAGQVKGEKVDALSQVPVVGDDPHVWLDPVLMSRIAVQVQAALTRVDPDRKDIYAANVRRYAQQLTALDAAFRTGLDKCDRNVMVTSHAAYLYLAKRYGLEQEAVTGASPESEPSPARLAELTTLVNDAGVTTIFTEPLVTGGSAAALARETGTKTATLDPLEGPPKTAPDATYIQLMRKNLRTLQVALGCR
jgi:zinc transport system substrate-binding protein